MVAVGQQYEPKIFTKANKNRMYDIDNLDYEDVSIYTKGPADN